MRDKKAIILFGAGAVLAWGGPKTSSLTELTREAGFNCMDNHTKITEFIFQSLVKSGYCEVDINFETLINVIEELIIHYAYFDNKTELPSLDKCFFSSRFEEAILNFSIHGGQKKHHYKLDIPAGKNCDYLRLSYNHESPEQFFFQHLLSILLTNVAAQISTYSYHTETYSVIDNSSKEKNALNKSFQDWFLKMNENSVIRMYTLNYDQLFKILSLKIGVPVFDGFIDGEFVPKEGVKADVIRILSDYNSNIYYNLHGSAFWKVSPRDEDTELFDPWISLQPVPILEINNYESAILQMEKGKSILISNIITGYQKTQKASITPFKQMQAAFDRDCLFADNVYIIGYSFSDEHINMSLKTAAKYNPNLKIHIVDPAYDETKDKNAYDLLVNRFLDVFTCYLKNRGELKNINDRCWQYFDGKITTYTMSFIEFLQTF